MQNSFIKKGSFRTMGNVIHAGGNMLLTGAGLSAGMAAIGDRMDSVVENDKASQDAADVFKKMVGLAEKDGIGFEPIDDLQNAYYDMIGKTIGFDSSWLPSVSVLAHELGHAKSHAFKEKLLGEDGALAARMFLEALPSGLGSQVGYLGVPFTLATGKRKLANKLALGALLAKIPNLAEEAVASYHGQNMLEDFGMGDISNAWAGFPSYLLEAAAPLAGVTTTNKLRDLSDKGLSKLLPKLDKLLAKNPKSKGLKFLADIATTAYAAI